MYDPWIVSVLSIQGSVGLTGMASRGIWNVECTLLNACGLDPLYCILELDSFSQCLDSMFGPKRELWLQNDISFVQHLSKPQHIDCIRVTVGLELTWWVFATKPSIASSSYGVPRDNMKPFSDPWLLIGSLIHSSKCPVWAKAYVYFATTHVDITNAWRMKNTFYNNLDTLWKPPVMGNRPGLCLQGFPLTARGFQKVISKEAANICE